MVEMVVKYLLVVKENFINEMNALRHFAILSHLIIIILFSSVLKTPHGSVVHARLTLCGPLLVAAGFPRLDGRAGSSVRVGVRPQDLGFQARQCKPSVVLFLRRARGRSLETRSPCARPREFEGFGEEPLRRPPAPGAFTSGRRAFVEKDEGNRAALGHKWSRGRLRSKDSGKESDKGLRVGALRPPLCFLDPATGKV